MTQVNFQLILPTSNLDVSNYEDPLSFSDTADDVFYVNPLASQTFTIKIQHYSVMDYTGLLPSWRERLSIHDIGQITTTINYRHNETRCDALEVARDRSPLCQPYAHFTFQSSGHVIRNKRTYKTIAETVGAIGGTNSVLVILFLIIYQPINKRLTRDYISKQVFSMVESRESPKKHESQNEELMYKMVEEREKGAKRTRYNWWRCCCCRKKTPSEIAMNKWINESHQRIDESLDVLNIVRNFNYLQVLTNFFFEERHFDLAQYVGFDLWRDYKQREAKKEKANLKLASTLSEKQPDKNLTEIKKMINQRRIANWMVKISEHVAGNLQEPKFLKPQVAEGLDEFFFDQLASTQSGYFGYKTHEENAASTIKEVGHVLTPDLREKENREMLEWPVRKESMNNRRIIEGVQVEEIEVHVPEVEHHLEKINTEADQINKLKPSSNPRPTFFDDLEHE